MSRKDRPVTPDGRYLVARGRLCRCSDPGLSDSDRRAALKALMQARRGLRGDVGTPAQKAAIQIAKERLGESGPVWWTDGAPDEAGLHPQDSRYADWWARLSADARAAGTEDTRG